MYLSRQSLGPVEVAFTDRHPPEGRGPAGRLDLALAAADGAANLRTVVADFSPDCPVADMHQVHGARVVEVDAAAAGGGAQARPEADALVTTLPDLTLVVRVADCVPVLLADPDAGVIAAVHSGRPGLVAGVVPAALARMRALGARRITAWLGPHICGRCYEVPAPMRAEVGAVVPESVSRTSWGTPAVDLAAGVRAQLDAGEVTVRDGAAACTRESAQLFSYRREGSGAGRSAGLIRRRG